MFNGFSGSSASCLLKAGRERQQPEAWLLPLTAGQHRREEWDSALRWTRMGSELPQTGQETDLDYP